MVNYSHEEIVASMTKKPLISVCVSAYNYGRYLQDCIESVINQSMNDWELIICDDCSTDNTQEVVYQYSQRDKRIRYVRNEKRLGMNGNIKKSADLGSGKYLKILCADDWLTSDCLEVFCNLMEKNPNVVIATSAEIQCDDIGSPLRIQFFFGEHISVISGERMLDRMAQGHGFGGNSSFFIRTAAYKKVNGYDENLLYAPDYDLAARLCRVGDYLHTDKPLFFARRHLASSSSTNPRKLLDVVDWFFIPSKVFAPRKFPDKEWRRFNKLTAFLTAKYSFNLFLQFMRGDFPYALGLLRILAKNGNFKFGIPLLPFHIISRIYRRITGKNTPESIPYEPQMFESTNIGKD